MPSPPSSSSSNVRVRAFIDFWNFQLSLDAHVDAQLEAQGIDPEDPNAPRPSVDWKKLGPWLAQKAGAVFTTAGEKGVIRYEGLHIYASHDPYKIKDDSLRKWLKNTVDRFPGVQVTLKERRPKHPPKCPVCHEPVNTCPVPECTASMKGTVEKGIDTAIVTDMIRLAWEDSWDIAVLVSDDADFIPAVEYLNQKGRKVIHGNFFPKGSDLTAKCWGNFDVSTVLTENVRTR
jgi:hypothetical protein